MTTTHSNNIYINSDIVEYCQSVDTTRIVGKTLLILDKSTTFFSTDDVIFIDNFYLEDPNGVVNGGDFSGAYKVEEIGEDGNNKYYQIDLSANDLTDLKSVLKISNYNGMKIEIVRVTESETDNVDQRYRITKELL